MAISNNIFQIIAIYRALRIAHIVVTDVLHAQQSCKYQTTKPYTVMTGKYRAHYSDSFNIVMSNGAIEGATASKQRFVTLLHSLLVRVYHVETGIF